MYTDDEEKKGFPIRDFLLRLVLIIIFVLLLMWLLPTKTVNNGSDVDLSPLTNRIFNANIKEMKEAAIPYFTTERLPKNVGDHVKLTLQEMLDLKLLLPFTDKNGDTCDTQNSYVEVTKEENEYVLKVYLKCNDDEDYILVHIGCYSYCTTENGVCEKEEDPTKPPTTTRPTTSTQTTAPSGPNCILEVASGPRGENGWFVGNVKVRFKSKQTTSRGARITKFGLTTSSVATYNNKSSVTVSKDGTTRVYGYVKDSNGKTAICTVTVKRDTVKPNCAITVLSGTKKANGYYVGTVKVGFSSRTDKTSGVANYGMDTTSKPNYNHKTTYSVSKKGSTTVYGYVKDRAGHTRICSTKVKVDEDDKAPSKPSCELEITSGTLGNNNWYRSNVKVGWKSRKSTNGATIVDWGIGTKENYNNGTSYEITKDGNYVVKGYVKDSNGYIATCSITLKRDATKPNCSLSVTSGTQSSDGSYRSNVTLGWKSRSDNLSGVDKYGMGKSTNYSKNTSYTITTPGKHTVHGYITDRAGNTNVCSITVEKKEQSYEYQYSKDVAVQYGAWSGWTTSEYDCSKPPKFYTNSTYQSEDLGSTQKVDGYVYSAGKSITAKDIKQTGKVSEKTCSGWTYYRSSTTSTKTYAIKVAEGWKYVGLVSLSSPPTNTLSTKYEFVGMDWDRCGSKCTTTPYTTWKKYTRNVSTRTATDTIVTGSSVTVKCDKFETKDTILYTTYSKIVGYEQNRTIKYKKVCTYRHRSRSVVRDAYTDYKWSTYNDKSLLDAGYKMTGNKRIVS